MSKKFEGNLPPQEQRESEKSVFDINEYFNNLYDQIEIELSKPEPRKKISTIFYDSEGEIGKILRGLTGNPNIVVKITSDDEQELYDMDWHYPPYLEVYDGPIKHSRYYPGKEQRVINSLGEIRTQERLAEFVEQNKLPKKE